MARIRITALLGALVTLALGGGCARDSAVADHWGKAMRHNAAEMVAHPEADKLPAHEGVDGLTAEQTMDKYRRAQAKGPGRGATSSIINIDAK